MVATVDTLRSRTATIDEYAVKMFENRGRGIGERGRDNGLLIVLAVKDRRVKVEVGYELEQFITDGFAGETSREDMAPPFRRRASTARGCSPACSASIGRIAQGRNVTLAGRAAGAATQRRRRQARRRLDRAPLFVLFMLINVIAGRMRRATTFRRRLGRRWAAGQRRRSVRRRVRRWVRPAAVGLAEAAAGLADSAAAAAVAAAAAGPGRMIMEDLNVK